MGRRKTVDPLQEQFRGSSPPRHLNFVNHKFSPLCEKTHRLLSVDYAILLFGATIIIVEQKLPSLFPDNIRKLVCASHSLASQPTWTQILRINP